MAMLQVVPNYLQDLVHGLQGLAKVYAQGMDVGFRLELAPANRDRDDAMQHLAIFVDEIALAIPSGPEALDAFLDLIDQGRPPGAISTNGCPER